MNATSILKVVSRLWTKQFTYVYLLNFLPETARNVANESTLLESIDNSYSTKLLNTVNWILICNIFIFFLNSNSKEIAENLIEWFCHCSAARKMPELKKLNTYLHAINDTKAIFQRSFFKELTFNSIFLNAQPYKYVFELAYLNLAGL